MAQGKRKQFPAVWQGSASQWECDHMGHLNTRFYIKRLGEGVRVFSVMLGLSASQTLRAVQVNARFLNEIHVPQPLRLHMGLASPDGDAMLLWAELRAVGEERLFAVFMLRVGLFDIRSNERLALTAAMVEKAQDFQVVPDERLLPRSYGFDAWSGTDDSDRSRPEVGVGAFGADGVDLHGVMRLEEPIARLADCMGGLMIPYRAPVIEYADPRPERPGGAMLETRIDILRWPCFGDAFRLDAALTGFGSKTLDIESRMTAVAGGELIASMRCVTIVFDLDRRRAVSVTPAAGAALRAMLAG